MSIDYVRKYWGKESVTEETMREEKFPLVDIQTTLTFMKIKQAMNNVSIDNILDAGAGVGRYSLPLAKIGASTGLQVTHLDISDEMLNHAKKIADSEEITNVEFIKGDVTKMSEFKDKQFDMTICFDSPISYTYPNHYFALKEVARVTKKVMLLMVSSRPGILPFMIDFDLSREYLPKGYRKKVDPFLVTESIIKNGVEVWPDDIKEHLEKTNQDAPSDYSFDVDEILNLVRKEGFHITEVGGPGALARSIKKESLEKIRKDERLFNRFIEYSLKYDFSTYNLGLGAVNLYIAATRK